MYSWHCGLCDFDCCKRCGRGGKITEHILTTAEMKKRKEELEKKRKQIEKEKKEKEKYLFNLGV